MRRRVRPRPPSSLRTLSSLLTHPAPHPFVSRHVAQPTLLLNEQRDQYEKDVEGMALLRQFMERAAEPIDHQPADERAGPDDERAGPGDERAGPDDERAGPADKRAGPADERAGPAGRAAGADDAACNSAARGFQVGSRGSVEAASYRPFDSRPSSPLHLAFLANMWDERARLFPLRMDSCQGLRTVHELGAPVGLVYIDADHSTQSVLSDLRTATSCFPDALICGDDWCWRSVRDAVEEFARQSGSVRVHAHPAENWWWLEPERPPALAQSLPPSTQRQGIEFVSPQFDP